MSVGNQSDPHAFSLSLTGISKLSCTSGRGNFADRDQLHIDNSDVRPERADFTMRKAKVVTFAAILMALLPCLVGCGHKLVAHNGETTVNVYTNKEQFEKVESMKSQGGPAGILGGLGESMLAKKVDSDTPVKVLSSDEKGASVEILDGPQKGFQGYVANDNLN
jgi:hypothetical protein